MLCALIMAGGKGERFWPLSTDEKPKQFLNLLGEDTMIQMTVKRLLPLIPMERIFVVTGKRYIKLVKEQLPELPEDNIIAEPYGKNTAPCIALSAFIINKKYSDASIAVLPSDHLIQDEEKFRKALSSGEQYIESNKNAIVTLGIKPDRSETGYGYINYSYSRALINGMEIKEVNGFVEKPDKETAEEYIKDGHYLWNGGMFIWKAMNIINLTRIYLRNTFDSLVEIAAASEEDYDTVLEEKYKDVDEISIDYGIMEKSSNIYVIPSDFGWDDVGTWHAVERYRKKDENNNVCVGSIKNLHSFNNIVFSKAKPIVLAGLNDVFVVESEDMILIGRKEEIEKIKDIKKEVC